MKVYIKILFVTFVLLFFSGSTVWATLEEIEEKMIEGIEINESKNQVTVDGFLNTRYFQKPGQYAVVFRNGFNAKQALFIAQADPFALYAALTELNAVPGDNLSLDSPPGTKTEGSRLDIFISWDEVNIYKLEEIVIDSQENEFDIRFSGNLENSEEVSSGCLVCLDSCPIGITGNARWGNRAYQRKKVYFKVNRKLLPPNGTPVKIIFRVEED